jgi:holo-[acyl-carrier protein] synthase
VIIGVGTDILSIGRIHDILDEPNHTFITKVFTENERTQAEQADDPLSFYAVRFAGKEAVFKCFNIHGDVRLSEIEIIDGETGQPQVMLFGRIREIAAKKGISRIHVSLSFENDYAIAFAVAENIETHT